MQTRNYTEEELLSALSSKIKIQQDKALKWLYQNPELRNSIRKFILANKGKEADFGIIYKESIADFFSAISKKQFQRKSSYKTYIHSIAQNKWFKQLKQKKTTQVSEVTVRHLANTEEENTRRKDAAKKLVQLVMKHSDERCQQLFGLLMRGFGYEAIAKETGYKRAVQARKTMSRCRKKLRQLMKTKGLIQ